MNGLRKTIYVKKDVANRMKDYPEVNWSGLASKAFEAHMAQIDAIRAINKMHKDHMEKEYGPKVGG